MIGSPKPLDSRLSGCAAVVGGCAAVLLNRDIWTEIEMMAKLDRMMSRAFDEGWRCATEHGTTLRRSVIYLGDRKVIDAHQTRGLYP